MAAAGVPLRTLQEWLGHRDYKTTLIYADYQPLLAKPLLTRGFVVSVPSQGAVRAPNGRQTVLLRWKEANAALAGTLAFVQPK